MSNNTIRLNVRKEFDNVKDLNTMYDLNIHYQMPKELYSTCIRNKNWDIVAEWTEECFNFIRKMKKW